MNNQEHPKDNGPENTVKEEIWRDNAKAAHAPSKGVKLPLKIILPAIVIAIAIVLVLLFFVHPAKPAAVSYTTVTGFTPSSLSSLMGGNWSMVENVTANSSTVSAHAASFPPGTVAAALQEFIHSNSSALSSNSSNTSVFASEAFYINSSSSADSLFSEVQKLTATEYANNSKVTYNTSTIGNTEFEYVNGRVNATNSSLIGVTEIYAVNAKTFMIETMQHGNIGYTTAEKLISYLFP